MVDGGRGGGTKAKSLFLFIKKIYILSINEFVQGVFSKFLKLGGGVGQ